MRRLLFSSADLVFISLLECLSLAIPVQVFQCLLLQGENCGESALRDAEPFYISDEDFQVFLDRHKSVPMLVPEGNAKVRPCRWW